MTTIRTSVGVTMLEAPGTICPEQFRDLWSGTTESPGEIQLAMAVLARAIEDLRKFWGAIEGSQSGRRYREAHRWIASNDRKWPFSFLNISEILNISSARIRIRLLEHAPLCSKVSRARGAGRFRRNTLFKSPRQRRKVPSESDSTRKSSVVSAVLPMLPDASFPIAPRAVGEL
jgi:hypothetical protein